MTTRHDIDILTNEFNDLSSAAQIVVVREYGKYKIQRTLPRGIDNIYYLNILLSARECELVLRGMITALQFNSK